MKRLVEAAEIEKVDTYEMVMEYRSTPTQIPHLACNPHLVMNQFLIDRHIPVNGF
jgi:hypothetical protein